MRVAALDLVLAGVLAVAAGPELSVGEQDTALLVAAENLLDEDRLLCFDRVQILVCFIKANVLGQVNFLWHAEKLCFCCGTLSMLVVTPDKERALLNTTLSNFFNLLFKLTALILIIDTQRISHPIIISACNLLTVNLAIKNEILTGCESNL